MFEAVVGDAEGGEPGVEEVGVAVAVLLEGVGGGVELAAVEFDDEVLLSVDGVDFVAGDGLVALGERELVGFQEAGEAVFEVGAGGAPLGVSGEVRRPGYRVRRVVSSAPPAVKEVETPDLAAMRDRGAVQTGGEQLWLSDHAMLLSRQSGDENIGCGQFVGIIATE